MNNLKIKFTIGVPKSLNETKKIIDDNYNDLYQPNYATDYKNTFAKIIDYELYGIKGKAIVGLDTDSRNMLIKDLNFKIVRYEEELKSSRKKYETIIKEKKYAEYFTVLPKEDSKGFKYEINQEKIKEASKYLGYVVIFSTDKNITARSVIYHYREKDIDEKGFYSLKNYIDFKRLRTHNLNTTEGKTFVEFIALILKIWIDKKFDTYKKAHSLTTKKLIKKLSNIQVIKSKKEVRYLKSITKEQEELLNLFDYDSNKLLKVVKKQIK